MLTTSMVEVLGVFCKLEAYKYVVAVLLQCTDVQTLLKL